MPTQDETQKKIKEIIVDELGCDENEITPNAHFVNDLGADSLDTVELAIRLEEEFEVDCPDEDLEKINTVGELYAYIEKATAK